MVFPNRPPTRPTTAQPGGQPPDPGAPATLRVTPIVRPAVPTAEPTPQQAAPAAIPIPRPAVPPAGATPAQPAAPAAPAGRFSGIGRLFGGGEQAQPPRPGQPQARPAYGPAEIPGTGSVFATVRMDGKTRPGIRVSAGGVSATSDEKGIATLRGVKPGDKVEIVASALGLRTATKTEKVVPNGSISVTLDMTSWEMRVPWQRILIPAIAVSALLILAVLYRDQIGFHFLTVTSVGPAVVGGLLGYILIGFAINAFDAVTRGERGWYEDLWVPPAATGAILFMPLATQGAREWAMSNISTTNGIWQAAELLGAIKGGVYAALAVLLFRAITVQRLEHKLDTSPLMPTFGTVLAVVAYSVSWLKFEMATWLIVVFAIGLVVSLFVEIVKKPTAGLIGFGLGVAIALSGSILVSSLLGASAIAGVFGHGVWAHNEDLDRNPKTEARRTTEYMAMILLEVALQVAFWGSFLIQKLGR